MNLGNFIILYTVAGFLTAFIVLVVYESAPETIAAFFVWPIILGLTILSGFFKLKDRLDPWQ